MKEPGGKKSEYDNVVKSRSGNSTALRREGRENVTTEEVAREALSQDIDFSWTVG